MGFLLGQSDGEPPFNTADERHALADECIGSHSGLAEHYHATVRISVLNEDVAVPDDVGIDDRGCSMRPLTRTTQVEESTWSLQKPASRHPGGVLRHLGHPHGFHRVR